MSSHPEFAWIPLDVFYAGILWATYFLMFVYAHRKIRIAKPEWMGLAEMLAAIPALTMLVMGAIIHAVYLG